MNGLADAALLAAVAIGCVRGSAALAGARWPWRSPAVAILLWQALGLAGGFAAVGALLDLGSAPRRTNVVAGVADAASLVARGRLLGHGQATLPAILRLVMLLTGLTLLAVLCGVLVLTSAAVLRARRRQRALLALLAHVDPKVPGALVVDHPAAAAYCLPGLRSRIVLSAGTLNLLRPAELAAVLEHERAHLRERHDLVLLPFTALRRAFKRSKLCAQAHRSVALLVEMLADDRALRTRSARVLAAALMRFGAACHGHPPAGALGAGGMGDSEIAVRVSRLLEPAPRLPVPAGAAVCAGAVLLVVAPVVLLVLPG